MKRLFYILMILCSVGLYSCLDDQTTEAHINISDIEIAPMDSFYFVNLGEKFVLDAGDYVSQEDTTLPMKYTWQGGVITHYDTDGKINVDSMHILSTQQVLEYRFDKLKTYYLRLKAENRDYAEFTNFCVVVSSGFDEGLVLFSKNSDGEGMLSYLNSKTNEAELRGKKAEDFKYVTKEALPELAQDAVDFNMFASRTGNPKWGDRNNYFYLLSRENQKAYFLDQYSLQKINEYGFSKRPEQLALIFHDPGFDLFTYCEDGDVISHCGFLNAEVERKQFEEISSWDDAKIISLRLGDDGKSSYCDNLYLFDDKNSGVCAIMGNDITADENFRQGPAYFPGYDVVNIGLLRKGGWMAYQHDAYVILRSQENPRMIRQLRYPGVFAANEFLKSRQDRAEVLEYELPEGEDLSLTRESKIIGLYYNNYPQSFAFNTKNRVYIWQTSGNNLRLPRLADTHPSICFDVAKEVGPNAEVIDMTDDPSGNWLFVAVYNPDAPGDMKTTIFSLWAYDFSFHPQFTVRWDGVGYKPVKLFYKPNVQREWRY